MKKNNGTGVQDAINRAVFELLDRIVVYPVEDENKLCNKQGDVLPDAVSDEARIQQPHDPRIPGATPISARDSCTPSMPAPRCGSRRTTS